MDDLGASGDLACDRLPEAGVEHGDGGPGGEAVLFGVELEDQKRSHGEDPAKIRGAETVAPDTCLQGERSATGPPAGRACDYAMRWPRDIRKRRLTGYGTFGGQLAATIRAEVFDEDIGQNSWVTADEYRRYFAWLGLGAASVVLEVASGSGGPALFSGCSVRAGSRYSPIR